MDPPEATDITLPTFLSGICLAMFKVLSSVTSPN
jgi:hypothetical protein